MDKETQCLKGREHIFPKWKIIEDETGMVGGTLIQERKCIHCSFVKRNKQSY